MPAKAASPPPITQVHTIDHASNPVAGTVDAMGLLGEPIAQVPVDVHDEWTRQAIENVANRLYGHREVA